MNELVVVFAGLSFVIGLVLMVAGAYAAWRLASGHAGGRVNLLNDVVVPRTSGALTILGMGIFLLLVSVVSALRLR